MKSLLRITSIALFLVIASGIVPQRLSAQGASISFQVFYDDLSPYGSWVNNAEYGYVWYPDAGSDFTPYGSNGYWVYTEVGWTWVSYYPWGWAPFHYGRWYYDPMYGNMWVPGNEWGPGWVTWRQSEGYYGWAPIGPGISLEMAYSRNYNVRNDQWRFVKNGDFGREHINNYYVDRSTNVTIINTTTVINNSNLEGGRSVGYNTGPRKADVERRVGKTFAPIVIKDNAKHGEAIERGELKMYRPQVQKSNVAAKEAPKKVAELRDLKSPVQQNNGKQSEKTAPNQSTPKTSPVKQDTKQQRNEPAKQNPVPQKRPVQPIMKDPVQPKPQRQNQQHPQPEPQKQPAQPNRQEPQAPRKTEPGRQQPAQPASTKPTPQNKQQPEPTRQQRAPIKTQPNNQLPQQQKQEQLPQSTPQERPH